MRVWIITHAWEGDCERIVAVVGSPEQVKAALTAKLSTRTTTPLTEFTRADKDEIMVWEKYGEAIYAEPHEVV